jgi:hypothetical protein
MSPAPRRGRLTLGSLAVALVAMACVFAPSAAAENAFTLDPLATSPGRVVMDPAGNAYIAWTHASSNGLPDTPMFCKIPPGGTCDQPISLPIPGAVDNTDAVSGLFPILRSENSVWVVGPRYSKGDLVVWGSYDQGQDFTPAQVVEGAYSKRSEPTNVLLLSTLLLAVGFNPGLGFGWGVPGLSAGPNYQFFSAGTVGGANAGLEGLYNPVIAYWSGTEPYKMSFYRYLGGETFDPETTWEGPIPIGDGYQVKLASDAGRLFMVSQDYAGGPHPSRIDVRRYQGASFGPPIPLTDDAAAEAAIGGAIAESSAGEVAVAWPGPKAVDQSRVMRLFTSVNRGTSFSGETAVARVLSGYRSGDNAQLAFGGEGSGLLTYRDSGGLQVANLKPYGGPTQHSAQSSPKPPNYKGKKRTVSKRLGAFAITMRLPKSCVQSLQSFPVGVGKKKRHRVAASNQRLTLKSVTFSYNSKLSTKGKKPFHLLVDAGAIAPHSSHRVSAKVTAILGRGGGGKKVVPTLTSSIKGC